MNMQKKITRLEAEPDFANIGALYCIFTFNILILIAFLTLAN